MHNASRIQLAPDCREGQGPARANVGDGRRKVAGSICPARPNGLQRRMIPFAAIRSAAAPFGFRSRVPRTVAAARASLVRCEIALRSRRANTAITPTVLDHWVGCVAASTLQRLTAMIAS